MAEISQKYLRKGSRIATIGSIDESRWETDEGVKRSSLQLIANSIEFIKLIAKESKDGQFDDSIKADVMTVRSTLRIGSA